MIYPRVALIGLGLIASSMAHAMRANGLAGEIVGYAKSPETRAVAKDLFCDRVCETAAEAVKGADLVVLAVPVGVMGDIAAEIGPHLKPGATVTDVGSVKAAVVEAVRVVAAGDAMLSPAHTRVLIDRFAGSGREQRRDAAQAMLAALSPREQEVALAVADGLSNAEIGARLFCSEATVKTHLTRVFLKLGEPNRVRLALLVRDAEA